MLTPTQRDVLAADIPARHLTGQFWRQTDPMRQPLELPAIAKRDARWHRAGDPWPAYAADSGLAAMLQLPRYTEIPVGEPPVLPQRRMSELHVDLPVLDIANPLALDQAGLDAEDLKRGLNGSAEAEICREIGDVARARGDVMGLLVPSAVLNGARDLVIFPEGFGQVVVGAQELVSLVVAPSAGKSPHPPP